MTKQTQHWMYVFIGCAIAGLGEWQKTSHAAWPAMVMTLLAQLRAMAGKDEPGNPPA